MEQPRKIRTIYKYVMDVRDPVVAMPLGSIIRMVGHQSHMSASQVGIWAEVDTSQPEVDRKFEVTGTGHPIEPMAATYLGSVIAEPFVWHIYERI